MDKVFELESCEVFQHELQQILSNLYYPCPTSPRSSDFEADAIAAAKQDLISIISECNFDISAILEVFNYKELQPEKNEIFRGLMEKNKDNILQSAFNHYNSKYGETVINYDWFVKFVFGTSELKTQKYPLLQLIMSTLSKNEKHNKIFYDINKEALLKIINALENII